MNAKYSGSSSKRDDRGSYLAKRFLPPVILVALIYAIRLALVVWPDLLKNLGIEALLTEGFLGLVAAPLLHTDLLHLVINTIPILLLGWFTSIECGGGWRFWFVVAIILVGAGAGASISNQVFEHSAGSVAQGASALALGFGAYVAARMFVGWNTQSRILYGIIALAVMGVYIIVIRTGLIPPDTGVTTESYVSALIAGFAAAVIASNKYMTEGVIKTGQLPNKLK